MSRIAELRNTVTDTTPLFAAVGVTDLAAEKAREARVRADEVAAKVSQARADFDPSVIPTKIADRVQKLVDEAQEVPTTAINRGKSIVTRLQESYDDLAVRGEKLVKRVRTQAATKDLMAQADSTIALGKGAVTSVRNAAAELERSARSTFTVGRKEVVNTADVIVDSIVDEASTATTEVKESAARTTAAAKATTTTAREGATKARTSARAATTSVRKTAQAAEKAADKAASKVGN